MRGLHHLVSLSWLVLIFVFTSSTIYAQSSPAQSTAKSSSSSSNSTQETVTSPSSSKSKSSSKAKSSATASDDGVLKVTPLPSKTSKNKMQGKKKKKKRKKSKKKKRKKGKKKKRKKRKKGKKKKNKALVTELAPLKKLEKPPKIVKNKPTFVEGDLVKVGQIGLLPWEDRVGVLIGIERLGEIYYGSVTLGMNRSFKVLKKKLDLTVGIPLRFELLDARPDQRFNQIGTFRSADWDEPSDYAKVIQRLRYGSKEQHFYLDINRFGSHSLGHGAIMKRYDANLNLNTSRVGLQLDAFSDYIGMESTLNDIANPNVIGALVFVKPLSFVNRRNFMLRSFSVGFTSVLDTGAPLRNDLDREDIDQDGRRESELKINQNNFQPISLEIPVRAYGVDIELKFVDKRHFDLKSYIDYSFLESGLPTTAGESINSDQVGIKEVSSSGFTLGHLIRSNLGLDPIHALRFRVEYRNYDPNYLPSYFDTLYEIQRIQYLPGGQVADLANATKIQKVLGRDPNADRVHGGYVEGSWRLASRFAMAIGLEFNNQTPDNHFFIHLEVPRSGNWQFSTTYHRRNGDSVKDLFTRGASNNDIWVMQTRYKVANWMHTNLALMTPFGFGPESVFRSSLQVNFSVELGWDFSKKKKKKQISTKSTAPVEAKTSSSP